MTRAHFFGSLSHRTAAGPIWKRGAPPGFRQGA